MEEPQNNEILHYLSENYGIEISKTSLSLLNCLRHCYKIVELKNELKLFCAKLNNLGDDYDSIDLKKEYKSILEKLKNSGIDIDEVSNIELSKSTTDTIQNFFRDKINNLKNKENTTFLVLKQLQDIGIDIICLFCDKDLEDLNKLDGEGNKYIDNLKYLIESDVLYGEIDGFDIMKYAKLTKPEIDRLKKLKSLGIEIHKGNIFVLARDNYDKNFQIRSKLKLLTNDEFKDITGYDISEEQVQKLEKLLNIGIKIKESSIYDLLQITDDGYDTLLKLQNMGININCPDVVNLSKLDTDCIKNLETIFYDLGPGKYEISGSDVIKLINFPKNFLEEIKKLQSILGKEYDLSDIIKMVSGLHENSPH